MSYAERKAKKLCVKCGERALDDSVFCATHLKKNRRKSKRASTRESMKKIRSRRKAEGKCFFCETVTTDGTTRCEKHKKLAKSVRRKDTRPFVGIDGEGQGRAPHRYVFLAASTEDGSERWSVENRDGLTTEQCLDFLFSIPAKYRLFAYSFNYDLTKILEDLDNRGLYELARPELRKSLDPNATFPRPVRWQKYAVNLQGTRFTVTAGGKRRTIWDIFKFFQGKFTKALEDWKVGDPKVVKEIARMKDLRSDFDRLDPEEVRQYCFKECELMAQLAHKLVKAHDEAGLKLKAFYGAGSSAGAMLDVMGIKEQLKPHPRKMNAAVTRAFFGGRFENLYVGKIEGTVYNYDISSAYPYQIAFLPCLVHGTWRKVKRRSDLGKYEHAFVRYKLNRPKEHMHWGPFPFRDEDGSICFPCESGGGWVCLAEYLAGEKLFPNVEFVEAWAYVKHCDCQPFKDIPRYYLERLKLGKEGAGIVLKLGCNSCYGKLAQSVGNAIFNSWVWAAMITSGTRAQILEVMGLHKDLRNLLMIATDGIYTREKLDMPKPKDTGTDIDVVDQSTGKITRKPLGGWEEKECKYGLFLARPGVYFPPNVTEEEAEKIRARGLGRKVLLDNRDKIMESWEKHGMKERVEIAKVPRFCGLKTSVMMSPDGIHTRATGLNGKESPNYGQWVERQVWMSFSPMPKRSRLDTDGTLRIRSMKNKRSAPYDKAVRSKEAQAMAEVETMTIEQPDLGWDTDYS